MLVLPLRISKGQNPTKGKNLQDFCILMANKAVLGYLSE